MALARKLRRSLAGQPESSGRHKGSSKALRAGCILLVPPGHSARLLPQKPLLLPHSDSLRHCGCLLSQKRGPSGHLGGMFGPFIVRKLSAKTAQELNQTGFRLLEAVVSITLVCASWTSESSRINGSKCLRVWLKAESMSFTS